ncbi:hypothetical protein ABTB66_18175, partial [Acinetobacter baumannii]
RLHRLVRAGRPEPSPAAAGSALAGPALHAAFRGGRLAVPHRAVRADGGGGGPADGAWAVQRADALALPAGQRGAVVGLCAGPGRCGQA